MKSCLLVFGSILAASGPAFAQVVTTTTAPAVTTVVDEACAGSVAEICQDAQAQQQAAGVQQHIGFDPLPTAPADSPPADLPNFVPPQIQQSAPPPVIPQQPPTAISSITVLPAPANAPTGSPPVAIQSQPVAPTQ